LLEGKDHIVRSGAAVSGVLDMRRGKHSLHFVVDGELLPHAIVNIPTNRNIHIGVCYYVLFIYLYFIIYFIYIYFIYSSHLIVKSP
jgi:hypothetical protein